MCVDVQMCVCVCIYVCMYCAYTRVHVKIGGQPQVSPSRMPSILLFVRQDVLDLEPLNLGWLLVEP